MPQNGNKLAQIMAMHGTTPGLTSNASDVATPSHNFSAMKVDRTGSDANVAFGAIGQFGLNQALNNLNVA